MRRILGNRLEQMKCIGRIVMLVAFGASCVVAQDLITLGVADEAHPRNSEGDIERLPDGRLLAVWTQFISGGADDSAAQIMGRTSPDDGLTWSEPFVVQPNFGAQNVMSASLLQTRHEINFGDLYLFFLVKNSNADLTVWWRRYLSNAPPEAVETERWSEPVQIPSEPGYHVMNNDRVVETATGRILAPVAYAHDIGTDYDRQVVRVFMTDDRGVTWRRNAVDIIVYDPMSTPSPAMEPGLIELANGRIMMIIRTKLGFIYQCFSADAGETWTLPEATALVSPAAPASIARLPVTNSLLIVWNNVPAGAGALWNQRNPLTAAISRDEGATWGQFRDLETTTGDSFAYTSISIFGDVALLSYYVHHQVNGWIDQRLRRVPIDWFQGKTP